EGDDATLGDGRGEQAERAARRRAGPHHGRRIGRAGRLALGGNAGAARAIGVASFHRGAAIGAAGRAPTAGARAGTGTGTGTGASPGAAARAPARASAAGAAVPAAPVDGSALVAGVTPAAREYRAGGDHDAE